MPYQLHNQHAFALLYTVAHVAQFQFFWLWLLLLCIVVAWMGYKRKRGAGTPFSSHHFYHNHHRRRLRVKLQLTTAHEAIRDLRKTHDDDGWGNSRNSNSNVVVTTTENIKYSQNFTVKYSFSFTINSLKSMLRVCLLHVTILVEKNKPVKIILTFTRLLLRSPPLYLLTTTMTLLFLFPYYTKKWSWINKTTGFLFFTLIQTPIRSFILFISFFLDFVLHLHFCIETQYLCVQKGCCTSPRT